MRTERIYPPPGANPARPAYDVLDTALEPFDEDTRQLIVNTLATLVETIACGLVDRAESANGPEA